MSGPLLIDKSATMTDELVLGSNMVRGIIYQSRKRSAAPFVNKVVVSGTFKKICGRIPLDNKINLGGKADERRLTSAITSPQASAESGASIGPIDAMPSVANSEAFRLPR